MQRNCASQSRCGTSTSCLVLVNSISSTLTFSSRPCTMWIYYFVTWQALAQTIDYHHYYCTVCMLCFHEKNFTRKRRMLFCCFDFRISCSPRLFHTPPIPYFSTSSIHRQCRIPCLLYLDYVCLFPAPRPPYVASCGAAYAVLMSPPMSPSRALFGRAHLVAELAQVFCFCFLFLLSYHDGSGALVLVWCCTPKP